MARRSFNLNNIFDVLEKLTIRVFLLARLIQELWHHWRS